MCRRILQGRSSPCLTHYKLLCELSLFSMSHAHFSFAKFVIHFSLPVEISAFVMMIFHAGDQADVAAGAAGDAVDDGPLPAPCVAVGRGGC